MKRSLLAVLCLALSTICITSQLVAAPHFGTPWQLKQPDGTLVDVRVWGDEYYQVVETPDGYTLMRDPSNDWIVYAKLSADGNELVSTGVRVGSRSPVGPQHIRINPEVAGALARAAREAAFPEMPASRIGGGPVGVPPKVGNVVGLVLLADFSDRVWTISAAEVQNFCNQVGYSNNGNNGSVHDYFLDVSNGNLNYTLDVPVSYHRASQPWTYYDDCTQPWLARAKELIVEILNEMEADGTDFSIYDSNGDGEIDAINLYFAGQVTSCGWAKGMWPGAGGMGGSFSADGVAANRFQITHMGSFLTLGTFCHENGHMVCGWPDLYDYDGDSNGVGGFDIMCNGMSNINPVEPSAELKRSAGWETITDLTTLATGINLPVSSGNTCFRWAKSATEYYLIENRQKTGRDASLPDAGLALWHVDTAKWTPGNGNDQQQRTNALHYYVTLVQADGLWELESSTPTNGDSFDLYAATLFTAATPCTDPNTDWWDGTESALSITNISASQATMTFDFSPEDNDPVALVKSFSDEADDDCCIVVHVSDIDSLSFDPDGPGDIAALCITQVDGNNVGCVDSVTVCGDGVHVVRLTITDLCGNFDINDALVEVIDNTPPVIDVVMDRDVLWPPNHKMVRVCATVTATDNCDDSLTVALVDVYSDEPDNDKGDGNTINDIQNATTGTNDPCIALRSERQGGGDGRCYTIVYSATDDAGNSTEDTVCVTVPHDQSSNAFSASGFVADGTALVDLSNTFAVVIPGSSTLDVTAIDTDRIYVGNTAGSVAAYHTRTLDADHNGTLDLAAIFKATDQVRQWTEATGSEALDGDGSLSLDTTSDGPIGLHFVTSAGVDYLVSNIYGLGAPVELPDIAAKDTRQRELQPITGAEAKLTTGISSVHPNPFNPQTTVDFTLASSAKVAIAIYDVKGSLVRRLVDQTMPAGQHHAIWNGADDAGRPASSGVYFLRMVAGSHNEVRKIVMLK